MFEQWKDNAKNILPGDPKAEIIIPTVFGVLEYITQVDWPGACHATSAVIYVMLKEQGLDCELCMGEVDILVNRVVKYFDHSWILIDGFIYDVAICKPLEFYCKQPATIKSLNIETILPTSLSYGTVHDGLDDVASEIFHSSFTRYMSLYTGHPRGLWGIVRRISRNIGLDINVKTSDQGKYDNVSWKYVKST